MKCWYKTIQHCTYTQVRVLNVERGAHVCEVHEVLLIQQDVDGDPAFVGRLHEVTQQVHICEHVHHHCYDLERQKHKTDFMSADLDEGFVTCSLR